MSSRPQLVGTTREALQDSRRPQVAVVSFALEVVDSLAARGKRGVPAARERASSIPASFDEGGG